MIENIQKKKIPFLKTINHSNSDRGLEHFIVSNQKFLLGYKVTDSALHFNHIAEIIFKNIPIHLHLIRN